MTKKTFTFSDGLEVNRLGYGTMQLTGEGVFGPYKDPEKAVDVLKAVLESEINFIDTADAYGPFYANLYVKKALKEYNGEEKKVIATKVGNTRQGPNIWTPLGNPAYLRQQVELNLFSLGLEKIDLLQLHRIDPDYTIEEQVGVLADMQKEGKIRHIGLSQVTVDQLKEAQKIAPIASVQNRYNLIDRADEEVLKYAEENNIAFIPWFPLATGELTNDSQQSLVKIAKAHNAAQAQIALAWLLQKSDVILPIPGTSSIDHLKSNIAAGEITLSAEEIETLDNI